MPRTETDKPYQAFAAVYDQIMKHVDYTNWADYIHRIFKHHNVAPATLLEIAAGTGNITSKIAKNGIKVTAFDLSTEMIKTAAAKMTDTNGSVKMLAGDMRNIPLKTNFDAAICLYDSINYLSTIEIVQETVQNIMRLLKPGGLFVFDAITPYNCRTYFNGYCCTEIHGPIFVTRRSVFDEEKSIQKTHFVFTNTATGKVSSENHVQTVHDIDTLFNALTDIDANILAMYKDFTLKSQTAECERVHFVLQKDKIKQSIK